MTDMTEGTNRQRLVLVSGATGIQGDAAARRLLDEGLPVRALTRNPDGDGARELAGIGAEVVQGALDDRTSIDDRALDGVDSVFSVQTFGEAAEAADA